MASDVEIDRALAAITATLNDQGMDEWDPGRIQQIVTETNGGERVMEVDDGGGLHDHSGRRVGAIRRAPSGQWFAERQNELAENSDSAIPTPGPQSKARRLLTKLKMKL